MAGNLAAEVSDLKVRVAEIAPVVQRMEKDLYNGGNGMLVLFTRFVASHEAHEDERDKTLTDQRDAVKDALKEHNRLADLQIAEHNRLADLRSKRADQRVNGLFHSQAAPQYDAHSTPPPQDSQMTYSTPK